MIRRTATLAALAGIGAGILVCWAVLAAVAQSAPAASPAPSACWETDHAAYRLRLVPCASIGYRDAERK